MKVIFWIFVLILVFLILSRSAAFNSVFKVFGEQNIGLIRTLQGVDRSGGLVQ